MLHSEPAEALTVRGFAISKLGFVLDIVMIDHDEWFITVLEPNHNGHPPEATALLRKPARLHAAGDLELVSAAMASYGGSGVARSLYYYRTGERGNG
jgi:hypothetical protein